MSEIECSRNILWNDQWQRVDLVELELTTQHPESFRPTQVRTRGGDSKRIWAFTKTVRLKKYGRKRLIMIHQQEDLLDVPRFLLTNAKQLGKWTGDGNLDVSLVLRSFSRGL